MFLQYAELIALDFSFTFRTNDDLEVLFYSLPTQLESYRIKHGAVKTSRWFSWHNGCESQYHEFWSTRMLLSFAHPHEADPDDQVVILWEGFGWLFSAAAGRHGTPSLQSNWLTNHCGLTILTQSRKSRMLRKVFKEPCFGLGMAG